MVGGSWDSAFSVVAPCLQNALFLELRVPPPFETLWRGLQTFLFQKVFERAVGWRCPFSFLF